MASVMETKTKEVLMETLMGIIIWAIIMVLETETTMLDPIMVTEMVMATVSL